MNGKLEADEDDDEEEDGDIIMTSTRTESVAATAAAATRKQLHIYGVSIHARSDRQKDRVELPSTASSEAMIAASSLAAKLSSSSSSSHARPARSSQASQAWSPNWPVRSSRSCNVVGWYHSHPRITILPSAVDLNTQASLQGLDATFVGLIFAVYCRHPGSGAEEYRAIAFRSVPQTEAGKGAYKMERLPLFVVDVESMMREPEWVTACTENVMENLLTLQSTLLQEEKEAYMRATFEGTEEEEEEEVEEEDVDMEKRLRVKHPMEAMYNAAVYQKTLCKLLEYGCTPLLEFLRRRNQRQRAMIAHIREQTRQLQPDKDTMDVDTELTVNTEMHKRL